jgi:hypothetical protein
VTDLIVKCIHDIQALKEENKDHGVRDVTRETGGLSAGHTDVNQQPEDHSWTELIERFDVQRSNGGIQLASNVKLFRVGVSLVSKGAIYHGHTS